MSGLQREAWEGKDFCAIQTAFSPAIWVRGRRPAIRFFDHALSEASGGPPMHFAIRGRQGMQVRNRGETARGDEMQASWIVAWFAGSEGWERMDVPWLLSLEKRPTNIALDDDGLTLTFREADTHYIASMPLYGYAKLPTPEHDLSKETGVPSLGVLPYQWTEEFPQEVAERCDWWFRTCKAVPIGFQESFLVDRSQDSLTFRQDYRWLFIEDDWNTEPQRFATPIAWLRRRRTFGISGRCNVQLRCQAATGSPSLALGLA